MRPPLLPNLLYRIRENGFDAESWSLDSAPLVIGREVTSLGAVLVPADDREASKLHARILREKGGFVLEDLQSANGTLLNGQPVERSRLHHGDEITVGVTRFRVELERPETAGSIRMTRGPLKGQTWTLDDGDLWVGRRIPGGRTAIVIADEEQGVSLQHGIFMKDPGVYTVQDLDSTNGIYVNNKRVFRNQRLADGDRVRMGEVEFKIHIQEVTR